MVVTARSYSSETAIAFQTDRLPHLATSNQLADGVKNPTAYPPSPMDFVLEIELM